MNDEDLRDLFAGLAMQGLIHHFDFERFKEDPRLLASWAYDAADAMIKAKYAEEEPEEPEEPEVGIAAVVKRTRKKHG